MSTYHSLTLKQGAVSQPALVLPASHTEHLQLHDSALFVIEPVHSGDAIVVHRHLPLRKLEAVLTAAQRRHALVVDNSGQLLGIINKHDLYNGRAVRIARDSRVAHDALEAEQLMTAAEALPSVQRKALERARIGDVALTLQRSHADFVWVMEQGKIVGLLSALTIVERTGESVRMGIMANSFAEIVHAVRHPEQVDCR